MYEINNFVIIESIYGKFLINRYCDFQSETLIKTGKTHIETELNTIFTIIDKFTDGCVVVDGGANAGFFTIPIAQRIKNKNGLVISFEPQRVIFNGLAGTIALNDLDNVRLNRLGLGDTAGSAIIPNIDYSVNQDFGVVSLEQAIVQSSAYDLLVDQNHVQTIRLDDLKLPRLDFYKLDVEGYEISALKGSSKTIREHRPFIWIEYWKAGLQLIQDELIDLENYDCLIINSLDALFVPKEKLEQYGLQVIN